MAARHPPTPRPDSRRVLLTGATGGLGPLLAEALARTGASVALSAIHGSALDDLAARLRDGRGMGGDPTGAGAAPAVLALPEDLRDPAAPERLTSAAVEGLGGVDILVHNAGVERIGRFEAQPAHSLEDVTRVNLLAGMHLSRNVLPGMLERGWGRLLFIGSMSGKTGPAFTGAYAASKAGLMGLVRALRAEYRGTGVSASAIVPGFVRDVGMYGRGQEEARFRDSTLLGTVSAAAVARALIRALETDPPEVLVQRGPVRLALALAELFPGLVGDRLNRWVGADRIFRTWARSRSARDEGDAP